MENPWIARGMVLRHADLRLYVEVPNCILSWIAQLYKVQILKIISDILMIEY